ncbi:MAG: hypothetical protein GY756_01725 [bacterium]|nr:hypothetical protein [bacterium]
MKIEPCRKKWKSNITDRERFNNQMHYKPIDRCFNMEFGYWDENFTQWDIFRNNGITSNEEADVFFAFDRLEYLSGKLCKAGMYPYFEEKVIEETETSIIMINREGLLTELPKDGHATIPHFLAPSVVTPDDWKKFKEERFRVDDPGRDIDIEELKKTHPSTRDYPLGVYCGSMIGKIRNILTFEGLAYACFDYPDMVEDMVETCCLLAERILDQVLPNIDVDFAHGWEDICFNSGPIVSLDFFKNVVVPRYKRINNKLKKYGVDIWYTDCDGDIRSILPSFMESGINCLFPLEINSCVHPAELLNEYGKDLRIMGGFDKLEMKKGKEAIKKYMKGLIPLVERGGYIPFCDHRCPPDVTPEDYIYYLDLKEDIFGMK